MMVIDLDVMTTLFKSRQIPHKSKQVIWRWCFLEGRALGCAFHAGGILKDALLSIQDTSRLRPVLTSKSIGASRIAEAPDKQSKASNTIFS